MKCHLLGVLVLIPAFLSSCASDNDGTYVVESPDRLSVTTGESRIERASYGVMQQLAAKETRPDGTTTIPSMRQSSAATTAIDSGATLVGQRRTLSFAGVDGTVYEIERLVVHKQPTKVTLRTNVGEGDERSAEFLRLMRQALGGEGLVELGSAE